MKKIFFSSLITILSFTYSFSQCNSDALCNTCIPKLSQGFSFLKTYKINGENDLVKVEYSYVFAKGTQYMLTLCDQNASASTITISIFDSSRNKVASNKIDGKLLSAIAFPCNATGIYYIQYTFDGSTSRCGGSALGFKRS
jgi:hypothetical protein